MYIYMKALGKFGNHLTWTEWFLWGCVRDQPVRRPNVAMNVTLTISIPATLAEAAFRGQFPSRSRRIAQLIAAGLQAQTKQATPSLDYYVDGLMATGETLAQAAAELSSAQERLALLLQTSQEALESSVAHPSADLATKTTDGAEALNESPTRSDGPEAVSSNLVRVAEDTFLRLPSAKFGNQAGTLVTTDGTQGTRAGSAKDLL